MKVSLYGLLGLVAVVGMLGCGTSPNPEFCCISEADCAALGVSEIRSCASGFTCDEHRCKRSSCLIDADCSPQHPVCSDGACVDCDEAHVCSADEPVCDLGTNTCERCTTSADCESRPETPYCEGGGCVQCTSSTQCAADAPVCDGGACRVCKLDSECESGACDRDGRCVPEDQIAYMATTNTAIGECTRASPCRNLIETLNRLNGRLHIVMAPGLYPSRYSLSVPGLFVHGTGAILLQGATNPGFVLQISKPTVIRGITVAESPELNGADVAVQSEGVVFEDVTFSGDDSLLRVSPTSSTGKASLTARNLTIKNRRDAAAVFVGARGEIEIDGGVITGNGAVGIQAEPGAKVRLKNVLITGTRQRALELAGATGEIEFTTIADAGAETAAPPCAVSCNPNLRITSSIIWQQTCAGAPGDAAGACTFASSIVSNGPAPGITNVDPRFVDPLAGDYHLQASSPAKDAVDAGPAFDFEGDPRPRGVRFDLGADEAAP